MKKSIFMICMILLLSFLLSGCHILKNPTESTKPIDPTESVKPTESAEPTESIEPTEPIESVESTESTEPTEPTAPIEHIHQWQDVSGEHARICTDCHGKQLKSEACNFVRTNCMLPMECTICHATSDEPPEEHDFQYAGTDGDCWSVNIIEACSKCSEKLITHGDLVLPTHRWSEETVDGKTTFTCTRCNESDTISSEIAEFSYTEVLEKYQIGDPGVKHEKFSFNVESEVTSAIDAITMAKFQLTIEYDVIDVSFDRDLNVWCVAFHASDADGGDQLVYLKDNGLPCYIVQKIKQ